MRCHRNLVLLAALLVVSTSHDALCQSNNSGTTTRIRRAAFLCIDGVYNSEFMAPFDILHHSIFRDSSDFIQPFIVTPDGKPFVTFEGITVIPHHSFATAPAVDILLVPSTATSMATDLDNEEYMSWLRRTAASANHVISLCDGAFPLAATGVLDGRLATTFPGDRDAFAKMFPKVDVRYDVNFVVDGKFITSAGGALSYEPALYLLEMLYSAGHARRTAEGLVLDWDVSRIPHLVAKKAAR